MFRTDERRVRRVRPTVLPLTIAWLLGSSAAWALNPSVTSINSHSPTASAPHAGYTVAVTVSGSGGTPTGTVVVRDGTGSSPLDSQCTVTLAGGGGSCTLTSRSAGLRQLTATYQGDTLFASSTSGSVSHPVRNLSILPPRTRNIVQGRPYAMRVALDVAREGIDPAPTGTITVSDGSQDCSITLPTNKGQACVLTSTSPGGKLVSASYSGDTNYPPMSASPFGVWIRPATNIDQVSFGDDRGALVQSETLTINAPSGMPESISADGRYTVFNFGSGTSPGLIPTANNGAGHVYLHDRLSGAIRLVSGVLGLTPGNASSGGAAISADGRFVTFDSSATNFGPTDSNGWGDVYRWDQQTLGIELVSVSASGAQGNWGSSYSSISADGRYVAFMSAASNLLGGDTNGLLDIFVKDMISGVVRRVSVDSSGNQSNGHSYEPSISADGKRVAFISEATNLVTVSYPLNVFVHDLTTNQTHLVSKSSAGVPGNNHSTTARISGNGNRIAFVSAATNLVSGDTNAKEDAFVHDLTTGQTLRVSVSSSGAQANGETANAILDFSGNRIAFVSDASNLAIDLNGNQWDVFVRDLTLGTTWIASTGEFGQQGWPATSMAISANGRFVGFSSRNAYTSNDEFDTGSMFVRDLQEGITRLISGDLMANEPVFDSYNGSLSNDGRYAAFMSYANNLVVDDNNANQDKHADIFVMDRQSRKVSRASVSNGGGEVWGKHENPSISGNGARIAFDSTATGFGATDLNGAWDIYLRDQVAASTTLISRNSSGLAANGSSRHPSIDAAGDTVAFMSEATDLVAGDSNNTWDVFVWSRSGPSVSRVSVSSSGAQANGYSSFPRVSGDGRFVAFLSDASNLISGDGNGVTDAFLHDRNSGATIRVSGTSTGADGNAAAASVAVSDNGQLIAFSSSASNLVSGDTNGVQDVFVLDRTAGTLVRISVGSGGIQGNGHSGTVTLSGDGRFVGYSSAASNLVAGDGNGLADVFVHDRQTGTTKRIVSSYFAATPTHPNRASLSPSLSRDGSLVIFESASGELELGDTNGWSDVFTSPTQ